MNKAEKHENWSSYILELMEIKVLTQRDLAFEIGTTQQSISNWLDDKRKPSPEVRAKLMRLGAPLGMRLKHYTLNKASQRIEDFKTVPVSIRKVCCIIADLHPRKRSRVLRDLNDLMAMYESQVTAQLP